jgi:hypothetical protein
MKIKTTPKIVWKKCALDIVGRSNHTLDGNRYVLTFKGEHYKYNLAVLIKQQDAETLARDLWKRLF